jgi:heme/copper-type cytochrome/quinol oxidase subunit 2
VALASAGALLLGACDSAEKTSIKRLAQPVGVTDRTDAIHSLWMGSWLAAMIVGVVVWGLIIYACIAFRRRRDDEVPVQTRYNLPLEILYTVAPVIVVLVLFYFTIVTQNDTLAEASESGGPNDGADHSVTVVGQQWSWTFNYDKDPALDGKTTVFEAGTQNEWLTSAERSLISTLLSTGSTRVGRDAGVPASNTVVLPSRAGSLSKLNVQEHCCPRTVTLWSAPPFGPPLSLASASV